MTTTIKKLVYRVWGVLDGNIESSVDSRFTYREIKEAVIGGIASAMVRKKMTDANNPESDRYGSDFDSKTYENLPVLVDEHTKLKKIVLPATIVSFFDNRQISVFSDTELSFGRSTMFIPVQKREIIIMKTQEFKPCYPVYFADGGNLLFWGTFEEEKLNVTLKGSIPNDDDAEISAPLDFSNLIVEEAIKILSPQVRQDDNATDGVPNP